MNRVPLIILGAGKVGRALVQQLLGSAPMHAQRDGLALSVVAWCDRGGAIVDEDGLAPETLRAAMGFKANGTPLAETPLGYAQGDQAAVVDVAGTDGCVVVDVTATDETIPALTFARHRGYGIATANKIPLTGPQSLFDELLGQGYIGSARVRFRYESTVGSAVPVIAATHALLRADDRIQAMRGALSGTLGFLCTGLQAGRRFSDLVQEAMALGYTEPDPRADLGGLDVARKALILARTLGWRLELNDILLASLVPPALEGLPLAQFMGHLGELDDTFAEQVSSAAGQNQVLRYVAELQDGRVTVGMQAVATDSALGRLRGNDNLMAFQTRYYPDEPLVIQGRGAGVDAAASGVHSDIIALAS